MSTTWNPWHGCRKISAGCVNCYVYRMDARHGKNSTLVDKTQNFNLPVRRNRSGVYKVPLNEEVYTCLSSDFFLDEADQWRPKAWEMIRIRKDCHFIIITKRIDRFYVGLPDDWGEGYDHVSVCSTIENQDRADYRLPIFQKTLIKHKSIICEPLLGPVDLLKYLGSWVEEVVVGGESGDEARVCDYNWVLDIQRQCRIKHVPFYFKQTGARFLKDGHHYNIRRSLQHIQAQKAGIDYHP